MSHTVARDSVKRNLQTYVGFTGEKIQFQQLDSPMIKMKDNSGLLFTHPWDLSSLISLFFTSLIEKHLATGTLVRVSDLLKH